MADKDRVHVAVDPELRKMIDAWRVSHSPIPSSAAVIRLFATEGLKHWMIERRRSEGGQARHSKHDEACAH